MGCADFDVVRRPTGGRAVWHAAEITYCAVVRAELLPRESRSVAGAYAYLSAGFLRGLQNLGVPVAMAPGGVRTDGANCFAASAGCDFVLGGKKLIGAAQCRKDEAILQHGSLLLSIDETQWRHTTGGAMAGATSLAALGGEWSKDTVIEALCDGLAAQTGSRWKTGDLSDAEASLVQLLDNQKYATPEWTLGAKIAETTQAGLEQMMRKWDSK